MAKADRAHHVAAAISPTIAGLRARLFDVIDRIARLKYWAQSFYARAGSHFSHFFDTGAPPVRRKASRP